MKLRIGALFVLKRDVSLGMRPFDVPDHVWKAHSIVRVIESDGSKVWIQKYGEDYPRCVYAAYLRPLRPLEELAMAGVDWPIQLIEALTGKVIRKFREQLDSNP